MATCSRVVAVNPVSSTTMSSMGSPHRGSSTGIPTSSLLRDPILAALRSLGGRGSNEEVEHRVAETLGLSANDRSVPHNPQLGHRTEFAYRLAWARTSLKKAGLITKVSPGVWAMSSGS